MKDLYDHANPGLAWAIYSTALVLACIGFVLVHP